MGKIIGIMNYKGGVGKTTTTVNLGTALWILGKKVLLVDADQQCNLSLNMKFSQEGNDTLDELMRGKAKEIPVWERYPGLDYIPASDSLQSIELYLQSLTGGNYVLKNILDTLSPMYDYILIDCAPKRGILNTNVLIASDEILIPSDCGPYSVTGLDTLKKDIDEIQSRPYFNQSLKLLGFVLTKYEKSLTNSRETRKVIETLFPGKLLDVAISKSTVVDKSPKSYMSVFEGFPESTTANDYMRLAEIIEGKKRPAGWKEKAGKIYNKIIA